VRALAKAGVIGGAIALAVWFLRRESAEPAPAPAPAAPAPPAAAPAPQPEQERIEGYCMKERKKVAIANPEPTVSKDGRNAVRGTCPDCGSNIFRFV
jgi:hypothetical protein